MAMPEDRHKETNDFLKDVNYDPFKDLADAFNGVDLFEGTTPAPAQTEQGKGALSGVDPRDPGVDISSFASIGTWKKLAGN